MTERPSPVAGLYAFLFSVLCMFGISTIIAAVTVSGVQLGSLAYFFSAIIEAVAFGMPVWFYYRRRPAMRPALRMRGVDPVCALLLALAALVGMFSLNGITVYWRLMLDGLGLSSSASGGSAMPQNALELFLALISVAVAPAFFEELLFRGLLLPSLEPSGRRRAIVFSGLMFALLHGKIEALPAHLFLGIMLGLLVVSTDSLPAAMIYHVIYNGSILLIAYAYANLNITSSGLPEFGDALKALPTIAGSLIISLLLLYTAIQRGMQKQQNPLPPAERRPLGKKATVLLCVSFVVLAIVELIALVPMLPGIGGAA